MDGFSYTNIFETKGIEYLAIIAFFLLLVPFWVLLNRQAKISKQLHKVLGILSANNLKIPQGLYFSKNHTWAHMERNGDATVGVDDLLVHITGNVKFNELKSPGQSIKKGDLLTEIDQNGKLLRVYSPISGKILKSNAGLVEAPDLLSQDPCDKGWIYKIKPSNWIEETHSYYLGEEATHWSKKEVERFKDFMAHAANKYSSAPSMVILQDGGELRDHALSDLPEEIWNDFQQEFLNAN